MDYKPSSYFQEMWKSNLILSEEVSKNKTQIDELTHKVNRALSIAVTALGAVTLLITAICMVFIFYLAR